MTLRIPNIMLHGGVMHIDRYKCIDLSNKHGGSSGQFCTSCKTTRYASCGEA